ncbi:MbtH family protein [Yersinia ruckeri]|uniref:MbtH family protein n=1 Tax=Yersinia ruckeri TaxID=29486 RepID=UPI000F8F09CB|nr:MbtH family NRPS accessory protein [Yersinia ruckeri]EKN4689224.1 MbtH family NRPS accessory protein [Yersinia ruckeri]EKN4692146.1 MbtH family NRPS accessory protein [Yersinia ruckeri]MCK8539252.1 MbtH family NRPS accessory protein [Yersinia ruckeri]MCK8565089.1 MbtH family NRPS accessory protein [Yersinia ruckeri]MCK8572959.1 MbtH family NRPS accessory protein [Yersinia ruckeri]
MINENQVNPFDDETIPFLVLINEQRQYSLWPEFSAIPAGWESVFGPALRESCVRYLEMNWTDMRPLSLINAQSK